MFPQLFKHSLDVQRDFYPSYNSHSSVVVAARYTFLLADLLTKNLAALVSSYLAPLSHLDDLHEVMGRGMCVNHHDHSDECNCYLKLGLREGYYKSMSEYRHLW